MNTLNNANRTQYLMMVAGAVLVIVNMLLFQQNKQLKAMARDRVKSQEIKPGTRLPALSGLDASGKKVVIDYGGDVRKTLLMIMSPGCGPCKENMENWQALRRQLDKRLYRVVGVSLNQEGLGDYMNTHHLRDLPMIAEPEAAAKAAYNLKFTPQTFLIDSSGKVEKVWTGNLAGEHRQDIESLLNVRF